MVVIDSAVLVMVGNDRLAISIIINNNNININIILII